MLALATIPGVYVPRFYKPHYLEDGTVSHMETLVEGIANPVVKRIVAKLPPPPTKFIVPNIEVVHNRVSVEIMRGCTRGCQILSRRHDHASGPRTKRGGSRRGRRAKPSAPRASRNWRSCRFRPPITPTSANWSDAISEEFKDKKLIVSLPSLRIESVSVDLMDKLRDRRSSGFTLAPEAATERMRRIINKFIPDEDITQHHARNLPPRLDTPSNSIS